MGKEHEKAGHTQKSNQLPPKSHIQMKTILFFTYQMGENYEI